MDFILYAFWGILLNRRHFWAAAAFWVTAHFQTRRFHLISRHFGLFKGPPKASGFPYQFNSLLRFVAAVDSIKTH